MANTSRERRRAPRGATIEDVAAAAGVSVATVSRALRNLPNVAPATAERVWEAARSLAYRPDPQASALAGGRSHIVGVAVPLIDQWYFGAVVASIERHLRVAGYGVMLFTVADASALDAFVGRFSPFHKRVDALIMADLVLTEEQLTDVAKFPTTIVTLGQRSNAFSSVSIDEATALEEATASLITQGHRRFGLIRSDQAGPHAVSREEGFTRALAAANLDLDDRLVADGDYTYQGGAAAMGVLLDADEPPTAVVALSDEMATGAILAATALGLGVPDQVSVIGFDDHPIAEVLGLSTVRQDVEEVGRVSAELIVRHLDEAVDGPIHHVVPTTYVERRTTAPPSG